MQTKHAGNHRRSGMYRALQMGSVLGGGLAGFYYAYRRGLIPLAIRKNDWAISMYQGPTPFNLSPIQGIDGPVLRSSDVTDVAAVCVADPFMLRHGDTWYMFFEVVQSGIERGCIGLASSPNAIDWTYRQVVLSEPFHLSYPYVFVWNKAWFMMPESGAAHAVRLYRATDFPTRWEHTATLLEGAAYQDPSPFYYNDLWWMFLGIGDTNYDTLHLYYARDLAGPWTAHPQSPVVRGDATIARPGGRVIRYGQRLFRYAQDCHAVYGQAVRACEILELTPQTYRERELAENPIISASGQGWNARGMHTVDAHRIDESHWLACIDGYRHSFQVRYVKRMRDAS